MALRPDISIRQTELEVQDFTKVVLWMRVLRRTSRQGSAAYADPSHLKDIVSNAKCAFHNFPRTLSHLALPTGRSCDFT